MARAIAEAATLYTCFIDADIHGSSRNIPAVLGDAVRRWRLDLAQAHGRLAPRARPHWNAWVKLVVDHIASYRGERRRRAAFSARLLELAARQLPSTH